MKMAYEKEPTAPRGNGVWVALVASLSLGLGVTGTLLWMQNRSTPTVATAPIAAPTTPDSPGTANLPGVPNSQQHPLPAELTAGMTAPQAALALGNWYYDHEKWDLALENYRRAIVGGVDNANVRTDMKNTLRFLNQPKQALEQYQVAQKKDPAHEQSLFNQGALYAASMNNQKKGIEVWQAYLKRFPNGQSAESSRVLMAQAQTAN